MNDLKIIELQLDRKIKNFLETAVYCPFGYPAVITVNPFAKNIAAPTIYWLSCPYLNYEVDRLEAESDLISELGERLKSDQDFRDLMEAAHQSYAASRKDLLSAEQLQKAKNISQDLYKTLLESGVGGIRDKEGIKCLHTHLADFLVRQANPVGKIVFNRIDWPESCKICEERIDQFESSRN
ncbi:hypothetical protein C8C77_13418 [Halanaerobium saccharolyticum]|uniref:DUF501 domain-containing protein n=1 Tax=Halanaerobium saccharolyticum TaxID=43595 RepID=A0A4R7YQ78_9FIRM|nr:DUF501 domain-containing protein [Halanaerobium saccharolyticum]RAK05122.1 hypothetical protein C7958_13018 [Halanaerobium saccharolyticum]TDV98889.1 hypothetical protein C8C77_13418 [Halanaerobium saccharolyticum]TDX51591.1 hypothetical protein C7956_13218 [Halanaerobium saccharolyticum]